MYHLVVPRFGRILGNVVHVYVEIALHRSLINRLKVVILAVRQLIVGDRGLSMPRISSRDSFK